MIKLNIQRFSSTNKTTHYELSQYVSSDLPTYLVDYNSDMSKIDTGINSAQTTADSASTAATNAATAAGTAQTTANTAITNAGNAQTAANTANTNIGTLADLTTVEKTNLVGAINEVNGKSEVVNSMSGNETNKAPSVAAVKASETSSAVVTLLNSSGNKIEYKYNNFCVEIYIYMTTTHNNEVIATLPEGLRPVHETIYTELTGAGLDYAQVRPDGTILVHNVDAYAGGNVIYLYK